MADEATRTLRTTVSVAGESHEVEVALPDGYLTPDEVREHYMPRDNFQSELSRRLRGKANPDELLNDEAFIDRVLETHEDRLREALKIENNGGPTPEQLDRVREQLRREELAPLEERLESLQGSNESLRSRILHGEVLEASRDVGVVDDLLPLVEDHYGKRVKWDDDWKQYFVVDKDGEFELTSRPERGKAPYKTVREDLEERRKSGNYPSWFKAKQRSGSGFDRAGGGGVNLDLDAQIAEAEKAGNRSEAARLKAQKLKKLQTGV